MKKFDVVVLGAGIGGYTAAIRLAQLDKKVAIIEKDKVGGICLNKGCIPTKALLHVASMYYKANKGLTRSGIEFKGAKLHLDKLRKWKNSISKKLSAGLMFLFREYGIEFLSGEASIENGKIVVNGEVIKYDNLILATGSSPNIPSVFSNIDYWTSYEALEVLEIPESLLVVGGGVIGVEIASIYAMFGSKVTIVEILPDILYFLDKDLRKAKARELRRLGVDIYVSSQFEGYEEGKAIIRSNNATLRIESEKLLVATGRKANTEVAEGLGIRLNNGFVYVDDNYMTSERDIFAIGDVIQGPMLAHRAHKDGINVAEYIGLSKKPLKYVIPSIVYGDLSLVTIGKSEDELIEEGINYRVGRFPLSANGRTMTLESNEGFCKILGDPDSGKIYGIHLAGIGVEEVVGEISLGVNNNIPIYRIAETIHAHPTIGEALMEAAENFYKKAVHIPNK